MNFGVNLETVQSVGRSIESLYNYVLFLTFAVAALVYLGLSMLGGRQAAPEPAPEREAVAD